MEGFENHVKNILRKLLEDPVVSLLLDRSCITKQQFSALIVDIISDNIADRNLTYEDKAYCMLKPISKGAYNRILIQARRNITKAFFTILLLSYIGLLDDSQIAKLIELGEKLRSILEMHREGIDRSELIKAVARLIESIEEYTHRYPYI
ncbi:MAG: hypothetical protein KIH04_11500 [Candidatus Freyarchaeota archaeon]|nr:hypothetical protein [Candidatus Jordarchaeia archaeon]